MCAINYRVRCAPGVIRRVEFRQRELLFYQQQRADRFLSHVIDIHFRSDDNLVIHVYGVVFCLFYGVEK
jgi:hypothetical protein